jgi:hypothetical protein
MTGVLVLALGVDLAALVGWLRRPGLDAVFRFHPARDHQRA